MIINVEFDDVHDLLAAGMEVDLKAYRSHLPIYIDEYGNSLHLSRP